MGKMGERDPVRLSIVNAEKIEQALDEYAKIMKIASADVERHFEVVTLRAHVQMALRSAKQRD